MGKFFSFLLLLKITDVYAGHYGVIQNPNTEVVAGGAGKHQVLETLPQGETVGISGNAKNGYYYVRTRKGTIGWIAQNSIQIKESKNPSNGPLSRTPASEASDGSNKTFGFGLSAGVTHPLELTLEKKYQSGWDLVLGGGWLSIPYTVGSYPIQMTTMNFDVRARWRPWRGVFFVGVMGGWQSFSASTTLPFSLNSESFDLAVKETVTGFYVTPHFGWLRTWSSGFTLGCEIGWMFPFYSQAYLASSTNSSQGSAALDAALASSTYQDFTTQINSFANLIGKTSLPFLTVLHIGWMF